MKHYIKYLVAILLITGFESRAQESSHVEGKSHESLKGASRLTLGLGHTHVAEGKVDGKSKWLPLASWSLNFDHWVSNKWAVGLQTDIILESFIIENKDEEFIERSYPISLVPVAIYKAGEHLSIFAGVGAEFAKEKNLTMTRLGLEYGFHLHKNWEVGAALIWDGKWNYYNSWSIAFTVSKIWPKKHHLNAE
jgi:hypothetical protein